MKSRLKTLHIFFAILALSSCNINKLSENKLTYKDLDKATLYQGLMPSIGESKMLVVPVQFSDSTPFSEIELKNISYSFIGKNDDNTNDYWESVKSYYYKTSYSKLNFNITVADVFTPSITTSNFLARESSNVNYDMTGSHFIMSEFYNNGTINNKLIDYKNFDSDKDGFVDGVFLIYNAGNDYEVFQERKYWAYTTWMMDGITEDSNIKPSVDKPIFSTYANCSQRFLYESSLSLGQDAHTIIHETGHMMGLDDYYTYDSKVSFSSSGGKMMMDNNIGDHDAFSKFALGWISPKLVTKEEDITLRPFGESGEALIISPDFVYNPFDEYLIIEYYTPTLLNELDSKAAYNSKTKNFMFRNSGIIVYHIDARIGHLKIKEDMKDSTYRYVSNTFKNFTRSDIKIQNNTITGSYYAVIGNNSKSKQIGNEVNFLIEQVNKNNISFYNKSLADDNSLFYEGDCFDSSSFTNFFKDGKFHNEENVNFKFKVKSLNSDEATITFYK